MAGELSMRRALLLTRHVDLVIGPETGVMNAAGCFDTPKIVLLSHSNHTNLTRDWKNVYPLQSPSECSPCYRIVGDTDICWKVTDKESPICGAMKCMAQFQHKTIVDTARKAIENAKSKEIR
jgi:ADP-heptose:LPS heptosyltransferase